MRKLTILLAFMLIAFTVNAQENDAMDSSMGTMDSQNSSELDNYNHWSIDLEAGVTKPARPLARGYYSNTPDFFQGSVGLRYMITERAGLKLNFGYNDFQSADDSKDFKSHIIRTSIQGVVNAGSIFHFRRWSNSLNLLAHGGLGYARLTAKEPVDLNADNMLFLVAGLTPQLRLSDHFALTGDISAIGNIRQTYTFDGTADRGLKRGVNGFYVNASIGISVYLGSKKVHADWYDPKEDGSVQNRMDELTDRVDGIRKDMQDTDQDGVPDYLDREPNTTNGVAVNTKGEAIDKNGNGIPDELEDSLDSRYQKNDGTNQSSSTNGTIAQLLNDGYVNVYFKFNSTQPETYSLDAVNYLIRYMKDNSSVNAELIGYADEIGNTKYNEQLSMQRAEKVKSILVASGIDENRLSVTGGGEDTSVEKSSSDARQIVRRVTFKLK